MNEIKYKWKGKIITVKVNYVLTNEIYQAFERLRINITESQRIMIYRQVSESEHMDVINLFW